MHDVNKPVSLINKLSSVLKEDAAPNAKASYGPLKQLSLGRYFVQH